MEYMAMIAIVLIAATGYILAINKNPTRRAIKDYGRVPRNLVVSQ